MLFQGQIPLVVHVNNADIMATLIQLKREVERKTGNLLKLGMKYIRKYMKPDIYYVFSAPVFAGGAEAWMIASEIAAADVSVILLPPRFYPGTWDEKRMYGVIHPIFCHVLTYCFPSLPGPPLSYDTPLTVLHSHNITVAIGAENGYEARHARFDMAWVCRSRSIFRIAP